jgi:hypothetical protein
MSEDRISHTELTPDQRFDRIEAALAEVGDALYRLTSPGRRPPNLARIMAERASDEIRPDAPRMEVRTCH